MTYTIREATIDDGEALLALLPRLGSFDIPESRVREHLWQDDEKLLRRWLDGAAEQCLVNVAADESGDILGLTLVSLRPELLSHEPSAHLEAIAVADGAEGKGVGQALLRQAEIGARDKGALSMTLHVFATNTRACAFYEKSGYYGELRRYIKPIAAEED